MSMTQVRNESASETANAQPIDMKLEVVVIPVSDVERSKGFYSALGWRLDADFVVGDNFRAVQMTPRARQLRSISAPAFRRPHQAQQAGFFSWCPTSRRLAPSSSATAPMWAKPSTLLVRESRRSPAVTRNGAATFLTPRSKIRTATAGCCRKSPRGFRAGSTRIRRASPPCRIWRARSGAQRRPTASTRNGPACGMQIGPAGTPHTWSRSNPARHCRPERR